MRLTILNSPLGLGLTVAPTATGNVRTTFPPSSTTSLRSGMLTSTWRAARAVLKSCAAAVEANSAASSREAVRIRVRLSSLCLVALRKYREADGKPKPMLLIGDDLE